MNLTLMLALRDSADCRFVVLDDTAADPALYDALAGFQRTDLMRAYGWAQIFHFDGGSSRWTTMLKLAPVQSRLVWFRGSARKSGVVEIFKRWILPFATHVACSEAVGRALSVKNVVIYSAGHIDWFDKTAAAEKLYDLAIVGRLRPVKNHQLFRDIVILGGFSFIVIGGTSTGATGHVNATERMLRDLARPGIDLVTGSVPRTEVPELIKLARVSVCTSDYEALGHGNLVEPMALGVPAVARRVGGTEEAFSPQTEWLLLPSDASAEDLVGKIRLAMSSSSVSEDCSLFVNQRFSLGKMLNSYLDLYSKVNSKIAGTQNRPDINP